MKNNLKFTGLILLLVLFAGQAAMAQGGLLKKIKARAEDEVVNEIFGEKKKAGDPALPL